MKEARTGRYLDALKKAVNEIDHVFDDNDNDGRDAATKAIVAALCAVPRDSEASFEEFEPRPLPATPSGRLGVNGGFAPSELAAMLVDAQARRARAQSLGRAEFAQRCDETIAKLTAALSAARAAGITDASVCAERAERNKRMDEAHKAAQAHIEAQQERWRLAPALAAQAEESEEVVTARVLVERGFTRMAAFRAAFGLAGTADELRDHADYKAVKDAVRAELKRAEPPPPMSPEDEAEWERFLAARDLEE